MAVVVSSTPASYSYFIGTCCPLVPPGWVSTPMMVCCVVATRWVMVLVVTMVVLMVSILLSWWQAAGVVHVWEGRLARIVVFIVLWAHVTTVLLQIHVVFAPLRKVWRHRGLGCVEGTRRWGLLGWG